MNAAIRAVDIAPARLSFDRIKTRRYDDQVFVADRLSGRWLFAPIASAGLFEPATAEPTDSVARAKAHRLLAAEGIGVVAPPPHFDAMRMLILKLTNACNYACTYCYDYETIERARVIDEQLARDAIEQALELAPNELTILLHGGEPMLVWPLIENLVTFAEATAARLGKKVLATGQTNLSRLSDRVVEFSRAHRVHWGVSIDGDPATNDRNRVLRNGRGTHLTFTSALERWPDFVRACPIMSTITLVNAGRLREVARYFRDLGIRSWDWSLFQPTGRGRDSTDLAFPIEMLTRSWLDLFEGVLDGEFDGFSVTPVKKYLDNFFFGPGSNMCMRAECGAGRDLMSVSADGTIEACDCIDPRSDIANLGRIGSTTLAASRATDKAESIRARDMSNAPTCGSCIWFAMCGGTCLAYAPSLSDKSELYCALSLTAFDAIAAECAASPARISRYLDSLQPAR